MEAPDYRDKNKRDNRELQRQRQLHKRALTGGISYENIKNNSREPHTYHRALGGCGGKRKLKKTPL